MANLNLCRAAQEEPETITFGTPEKQITIDITFVPSVVGFQVKKLMADSKSEDGYYTPECLASIVSLFSDDVDIAWIMSNCDYYTLNTIALNIIKRIFSRDEKN